MSLQGKWNYLSCRKEARKPVMHMVLSSFCSSLVSRAISTPSDIMNYFFSGWNCTWVHLCGQVVPISRRSNLSAAGNVFIITTVDKPDWSRAAYKNQKSYADAALMMPMGHHRDTNWQRRTIIRMMAVRSVNANGHQRKTPWSMSDGDPFFLDAGLLFLNCPPLLKNVWRYRMLLACAGCISH